MKAMYKNWKQLLNDCILLTLVFGTIGIALKYTTFFNKWVYFPSFPNIIDSAFLILTVIYLAWKIKK
jgi:hypothetical protein